MSLSIKVTYHCDKCGGPDHYVQGHLQDSGVEFELANGFDEVLLEDWLEGEGWLVEDGREYCDRCRESIEDNRRADAADDYQYESAVMR